MAFDQSTRNKLQQFVQKARTLLTEEFTRQMQKDYGMDPTTGGVSTMDKLAHLDDSRRETARLLRETMEHYLASTPFGDKMEILARIVREQSFTVLNRICAVRMAEARDIIIESVGNGYNSKGFLLYSKLVNTALGEIGDSYRSYLFSVFDEFAKDLPVLFDRYSPMGRLFPKPEKLISGNTSNPGLIEMMNSEDMATLWAEDETIGWIYQYFNSGEERHKMRESAAPQNSRELAVRNQFFTPRYVVEFLTDNTLGRIWYEMTRGETSLKEVSHYLVRRPNEIFLKQGEEAPKLEQSKEELSQAERLKEPVYIPFRHLKDPRGILMLDPACGSMHFGLYAFDLFERIYEEAWELEGKFGKDILERTKGLKPLRETYPTKEAFLFDIPRLIIEHNIHGIDIDPRAVQISGLSLWLRAQRSWKERSTKPASRPQIRKSGIVCAEPMPGEKEFLDEFLEVHLSGNPENKLLGQLVRRVFDAMKLAGEAGSLLKIEEEIISAVAEAKQKWLIGPKPEQGCLFGNDYTRLTQKKLDLDVSGISDENFWETVEARIYAALQAYAEQAENGDGYQRRLFVDDAARGFAFIDLCRKRYDVVLMNPPFGLGPKDNFERLKVAFPDGYVDLFACFISRGAEFCVGRLGAITSRAFLITKKLERLRTNVVLPHLHELLDLGWPVMDGAMVESAAYTLNFCLSSVSQYFTAIDKKNVDIKNDHLIEECLGNLNSGSVFIVDRHRMLQLPKARILYSLSDKIIDIFSSKERLGNTILLAKQGMKTFKDFRFLRMRSEVSPSDIGFSRTWEPIAKGGPYAVFYSDLPLLVKWRQDGDEIAEVNRLINGQTAQARQASIHYRKAGATYSRRSSKDFGVRVLPAGCIIGEKGPAILSMNGVTPVFLVGLCNSRLVNALVHLQANAKQYDTGIIETIPATSFNNIQIAIIEKATQSAIDALRHIALHVEGDAHFVSPIFDTNISGMQLAFQSLVERGSLAVRTALDNIDVAVDEAYNIDSTMLKAVIMTENINDEGEVEEDTSEEDQNEQKDVSLDSEPEQVISYCVGVTLGRWDIRFVTGEKSLPELPDPFSSLPVCPPGQLQNEQRLPITKEEVEQLKNESRWNYPIEIPWDGILVDDPGHSLDVEARVRQVLQVIWKDLSEDIEHEACHILGFNDLRAYFHKHSGFFADHLKRYSKSRRQAPIYWPLSTVSGSYTLWVYYHRLTYQTLYTCVNDFVEPKLKQITEVINELRRNNSRNNQEEKELERFTDFELELKDFRDELLRVAKFWKPNINDGVQITASPLWKFFRLPKWQKALKDTWEQLENGDYDWAHLAFSIWPERVIKKAQQDRSIAIAHDLEDELWEEVIETNSRNGNSKKKWVSKKLSEEQLKKILQTKTNNHERE